MTFPERTDPPEPLPTCEVQGCGNECDWNDWCEGCRAYICKTGCHNELPEDTKHVPNEHDAVFPEGEER